jgi:thymidylate kinase
MAEGFGRSGEASAPTGTVNGSGADRQGRRPGDHGLSSRIDALVTLDVVYEGVRLGLHRALVRLLVPPADVTLLLAVPPATAVARKPADMFVESVLARQAARYTALKSEAPSVRELDGTRPIDELAAEAFRLVAGIGRR